MKSSEDNVENRIDNEKHKYVEKRKAQIDKWNDEIEDLNARITVADADAEAKIEHKAHVAALRQQRDDARAKLTEIEEADDDRWKDLQGGLENIWTNVKYGFEKLKAKF
jgi:predicted  nucleic acid-binding Zn-ribbon protein